ncbi:hypothetical protein Q5H93_02550 [Hymenobacter sp. ASUV-10]|uniref:Outer membrane protein beta-barrel domain-containing protein n=1 Tax=Hymenobacter aranciens TaxID=3063996 RepID=A0ABT9B994_9BACT|nr:hypothetical protein [Hymenobacter sp. ASUV-10]MDO7873597.1 hypothetical protein [Hymenobacter sp. ASUV-10]
MKNQLFALLTTAALLTAGTALAQDKPTLNTAPPGSPPPVPRPPVEPTPAVPAPVEPAPTPAPQPTSSSPSGLELPSDRDVKQAGGSSGNQEVMRKLFIYSGFGLGYSSYAGYSQFNASISPALGYRVTDKFAIGPGLSYTYNNYGSDDPGTANLSFSNFGVKAFAQYIVYQEFLAHAEYEVTRAELPTFDANGYYIGKTQRNFSTPLLGIGYRSQLGERAAVDILGLYNFNSGINSIYSNPVIRINFLFNLGR